jgi:hypothetical protein
LSPRGYSACLEVANYVPAAANLDLFPRHNVACDGAKDHHLTRPDFCLDLPTRSHRQAMFFKRDGPLELPFDE